MGIDMEFGPAYLKSQYSTEYPIPRSGNVFLSVSGDKKKQALPIARRFKECGFSLISTAGTAEALREAGIECDTIGKVRDEGATDAVDLIKAGKIAIVINTPAGKESIRDSFKIRVAALNHNVPIMTTLAGANAFSLGLRALLRGDSFRAVSLQEYHAHSLNIDCECTAYGTDSMGPFGRSSDR